MSEASDKIIGYFWEYPEYRNAWKLAFEDEESKRFLVLQLLKTLPTSWGRVEFIEDFKDKHLVLLFTHNIDNTEARKNEFQIVLPLMEASALRFFGAEGATGRIDMDGFFSFPDQHSVKMVAEYLFRERKISPLIAAAFYSSMKAEVWGIEDPDLYQAAKSGLLEGKPDYWSIISKRAPVLFENFLLMLNEQGFKIGGVTITEHNFYQGHRYLSERHISHVGIRANSHGETMFGRTIQEMKAPPTPLERLFNEDGEENQAKLRKQYNDWKGGRT